MKAKFGMHAPWTCLIQPFGGQVSFFHRVLHYSFNFVGLASEEFELVIGALQSVPKVSRIAPFRQRPRIKSPPSILSILRIVVYEQECGTINEFPRCVFDDMMGFGDFGQLIPHRIDIGIVRADDDCAVVRLMGEIFGFHYSMLNDALSMMMREEDKHKRTCTYFVDVVCLHPRLNEHLECVRCNFCWPLQCRKPLYVQSRRVKVLEDVHALSSNTIAKDPLNIWIC
jgi:hypothetical protein